MIRLDDTISDNTIVRQKQQGATTTTKKRPFDALSVHVALEQDGDNVNIYANGDEGESQGRTEFDYL